MRSYRLWLLLLAFFVILVVALYLLVPRAARARAVTPLPAATDAARSAASASNDFALRLFGKLRARPGNLFFSPSSIHTALAIAREGAAGKTAEELDSLLALTPDIRKAQRDLQQRFRGSGYNGFILATANRLWPDIRVALQPDFSERLVDRYFVGISGVDYSKPDAAAAIINGWTKTKTQRISEAVSAQDIPPTTAFILTSTVYFKGDWDIPFKKPATAPGDFFPTKDPASKITATFMSHAAADAELHFADLEADKDAPALRALELAYVGQDLSMVLLLPEPGELADLESHLTPALVQKILGALHETHVPVRLPRFTLSDSHTLAPTITDMGAASAFSATAADFSSLSKTPLYLAGIHHKSWIEVNEEGTEAAAETTLRAAAKAAMERRPPEFFADRPFLFLIRDRGTNVILFLGRVADPTK